MLAARYARIAVRIQARGLPVIIQLVRFASRLTYDEVMERFEARSDQYREVPGLLQKYYVHYPETDEYGGVYVWDSKDSLQKWRETNLSSTLAGTYQIKDEPHREMLDVMVVLHADRRPL
jgi:hypothetical protein